MDSGRTASSGTARAVTWLRGDPADRARFTDMHSRFSTAPVYGLLVGGSNCIAAFTYGWYLLALVAIASLTMALGIAAHRRSTRPEVPAALTFALLELNLVVVVALTGGADSPMLALTLVPLFTQAVCFRPAVSLVGTAVTAAAVVVACSVDGLLPDLARAPGHLHVTIYLAVLGCLGLAAHHLADSDASARGAASLDALTGLFNRRALTNHFADTRARVELSGASVGLVLLDLDHFKAVNDTYGHDRGDVVLVEVAARLGAAARAGDLLYRVGGEEFVLLAPGADENACVQIAERLRVAVSSAPVCGLPLTLSAGVCSASAGLVDLASMTRQADRALYAAKRAGRDRVAAATGEAVPVGA